VRRTEKSMARDPNSSYYDAGGIETLDVIRAKLTPEQYRGYLMGNAIKYLCRANYKGSTQRDLEKAANYTRWLKDLEQDVIVRQLDEAEEGCPRPHTALPV
jgi:hypothetical protein